jgi:hypothetical protein
MGVWGTGIFDDDVAADVRNTWEDALGEGPDHATRHVFAEYAQHLDDEDDGPIVMLALATLQLDAGMLDGRVRDGALAAIEPNLRRWTDESPSPEDLEGRRLVLGELQRRIASFAAPS